MAAKHLTEIDGIEIAEHVNEVEYIHILFDRHEIVISNGAETESLYTGQQALKSVGAAAREEIFFLFPELKDPDTAMNRCPARPLVPQGMGKRLAARHSRHHSALVA